MANCRQWTLMTVVLLIEAVDLACDWFFFTKLHQTDDDYITENRHIPWLALAFCVLGTLTVLFESINLGFEVFTDRGPFLYADTVSMATTWVEDVPQICLALLVAIHQKSLIHWIQFVKVAWALVELIFRGVGQCLYCCVISERHNKAVNYFIAVLKFLAQTAILGCSIGIFVHIVK